MNEFAVFESLKISTQNTGDEREVQWISIDQFGN